MHANQMSKPLLGEIERRLVCCANPMMICSKGTRVSRGGQLQKLILCLFDPSSSKTSGLLQHWRIISGNVRNQFHTVALVFPRPRFLSSHILDRGRPSSSAVARPCSDSSPPRMVMVMMMFHVRFPGDLFSLDSQPQVWIEGLMLWL